MAVATLITLLLALLLVAAFVDVTVGVARAFVARVVR
jgi:hypothetical protein